MGTITLTLYPQLKLAHMQGYGDISEEMILGDLHKLQHRPDWQQTYNTLVDLGSAVLRRAPEESSLTKAWSGPGAPRESSVSKWAICAGDEQARRLLAERLRGRDGVIVDVFGHRHEALRFLNLSSQQWAAANNEGDDLEKL
jgi:hypothetical protein